MRDGWFYPIMTIAILVIFFMSMSYLVDIVCIVKHRTFQPPPNYRLVTNGIQYRWINPSGEIGYQSCSTRLKAVTSAWFDYDYEKRRQEREEIAKRKWEVTK